MVVTLVIALLALQYAFSAIFEQRRLEPLFSLGRSTFSLSPQTMAPASQGSGGGFSSVHLGNDSSLNSTDHVVTAATTAAPKPCPLMPPDLGEGIISELWTHYDLVVE